MSYELYARYWFWNKFTGCPDYLFVTDVTDNEMSFVYQGRRQSCTLKYAKGKLFETKMDLPGYYEYCLIHPDEDKPDPVDTPSIKAAQRRGKAEKDSDDNGWTRSDKVVQRWDDYTEQA